MIQLEVLPRDGRGVDGELAGDLREQARENRQADSMNKLGYLKK